MESIFSFKRDKSNQPLVGISDRDLVLLVIKIQTPNRIAYSALGLRRIISQVV